MGRTLEEKLEAHRKAQNKYRKKHRQYYYDLSNARRKRLRRENPKKMRALDYLERLKRKSPELFPKECEFCGTPKNLRVFMLDDDNPEAFIMACVLCHSFLWHTY